MYIMSDCILCKIVENKSDAPIREFIDFKDLSDEIILETNSFVVIADIAPLNRGHILIVSKKHVTSFSLMAEKELEELENLERILADKIRSLTKSNDIISFEHGLINVKSNKGSCINHAHLHVVPCPQNIYSYLCKDYKFRIIHSMSEIGKRTIDTDQYLLFRNKNNDLFLSTVENVPSQYFRYIYNSSDGNKKIWKWCDYLTFINKETLVGNTIDIHDSLQILLKQDFKGNSSE